MRDIVTGRRPAKRGQPGREIGLLFRAQAFQLFRVCHPIKPFVQAPRRDIVEKYVAVGDQNGGVVTFQMVNFAHHGVVISVDENAGNTTFRQQTLQFLDESPRLRAINGPAHFKRIAVKNNRSASNQQRSQRIHALHRRRLMPDVQIGQNQKIAVAQRKVHRCEIPG